MTFPSLFSQFRICSVSKEGLRTNESENKTLKIIHKCSEEINVLQNPWLYHLQRFL